MNEDYIGMLTYPEIVEFVTKVLTDKYQTKMLIKPINIGSRVATQEVEFYAIASNGKNFKGKAVCEDFRCEIDIEDEKTQVYTREWAEYVLSILKLKDAGGILCLAERYFKTYNENCKRVKDSKHKEVEQEFESSLLR